MSNKGKVLKISTFICDDMVFEILGFCPLEVFMNCYLVCKSWKKIITRSESSFFRRFYQKHWESSLLKDIEINKIQKEIIDSKEGGISWKSFFQKKYKCGVAENSVSEFFQKLSMIASNDDIDVFDEEDLRKATKEECERIAFNGRKITLLAEGLEDQDLEEVIKKTFTNFKGYFTVRELKDCITEIEKIEGRNNEVADHVYYEGFFKSSNPSKNEFMVMYGS